MNIFFLDPNPQLSASYHNNKHTVKMCVEYSQILASVLWQNLGYKKKKELKTISTLELLKYFENFPRKIKNLKELQKANKAFPYAHFEIGSPYPYGIGYVNHPSVVWCTQTRSNYLYLCSLGLSLCNEFERRYNKEHKCKKIILFFLENSKYISNGKFTIPLLATGNKIPVSNLLDVVSEYRRYYIEDKSHLAEWKTREIPYWYIK